MSSQQNFYSKQFGLAKIKPHKPGSIVVARSFWKKAEALLSNSSYKINTDFSYMW